MSKYRKPATIVLFLLIYFTVLTMISFMRSTELVAVGENLIDNQKFTVLAAENRAWADGEGLHFNDSEATEKVFSTTISLRDCQQIQVQFTADCPAEFAGASVLLVDLWADGYDSPDQEFSVNLEAGQNEIVRIIDKGSSAPGEALFRIFCLDPAQCSVRNLNVQKVEEVPHSGIGACAVTAAVLVVLLLAVILTGREKNVNVPKRVRASDTFPESQPQKQPEMPNMERKSLRERWSALIPAAFLSFTFCIFGPIEIYITNISELWFSIGDIFWMSILAGIASCGIFTLIGFLLPNASRKWYCCALIGFGVALYIQGNFIQTNYGVLDGREIQWDAYGSVAIWNTALWIVCLLLPFAAQKILKNKFKSVSSAVLCCALIVQVITLGTLALTTDFSKSGGGKSAYLSDKNLYTVSSEKNVVVFVLDTFDQRYLEDILEVRPDILDTWDGFTCYTNATCAYPTTKGALPFMLTGQYYKNEQPYNEYLEEAYQNTDFFTELDAAGYDINLYTVDMFVSNETIQTLVKNAEIGKMKVNSSIGLEQAMLRFTAFRYFPHIMKQFVWFYSGLFDQYKGASYGASPYSMSNISFYEGLTTDGLQAISDKCFYKLIHLEGTHEPFILNEDVTEAADGVANSTTQGIACLNIVRAYMDQLKELGVYDNTMIIVAADHGMKNNPGTCPIFLVKGFGCTGPVNSSDVPISHENLIPTVMEACGLNDGGRYGRAVNQVSESDAGERNYYFYFWDDSMDKDYLPNLTEFVIDAEKTLTPTGKRFTSQGVETYVPYELYDYQIGEEIVFIGDDRYGEGTRYFTSGISYIETYYAWSMGKSGQMLLNLGEDPGDLVGEFQFEQNWGVYAPPQRLVIRCGDFTLYDEKISSTEAPIRFEIPEQCIKDGWLTLDLEYPDAVSPNSRGEGEDTRELAFAFERIRFYQSEK